jgi:hypothetical protein
MVDCGTVLRTRMNTGDFVRGRQPADARECNGNTLSEPYEPYEGATPWQKA